MKQRKPLPRSTVSLKRTRLARGRKPIPQMSARREGERDRRAEVVAIVHARDKVCQGVAIRALAGIDCSGPLEVHELVPRGQWARGYLEPTNCRLLCHQHHAWVTTHPVGAHALALRLWSWERP